MVFRRVLPQYLAAVLCAAVILARVDKADTVILGTYRFETHVDISAGLRSVKRVHPQVCTQCVRLPLCLPVGGQHGQMAMYRYIVHVAISDKDF